MKTQVINYPNHFERAFWYCTYAIIVLAAAYIYFINSIVLHVVEREHMRQQIGTLQSQLTTLESRYVALSGTITLDLAHEKGFKDAGDKASFAYTTPTGVALSYRAR